MQSPETATEMAAPFYRKISSVHLEVTTRCNAACPQCLRNYLGGPVRPELKNAELSLEDVQRILPPDFVAALDKIYVNGNYGDGAVARDILAIFSYLRKAGPRGPFRRHGLQIIPET